MSKSAILVALLFATALIVVSVIRDPSLAIVLAVCVILAVGFDVLVRRRS